MSSGLGLVHDSQYFRCCQNTSSVDQCIARGYLISCKLANVSKHMVLCSETTCETNEFQVRLRAAAGPSQ